MAIALTGGKVLRKNYKIVNGLGCCPYIWDDPGIPNSTCGCEDIDPLVVQFDSGGWDGTLYTQDRISKTENQRQADVSAGDDLDGIPSTLWNLGGNYHRTTDDITGHCIWQLNSGLSFSDGALWDLNNNSLNGFSFEWINNAIQGVFETNSNETTYFKIFSGFQGIATGPSFPEIASEDAWMILGKVGSNDVRGTYTPMGDLFNQILTSSGGFITTINNLGNNAFLPLVKGPVAGSVHDAAYTGLTMTIS